MTLYFDYTVHIEDPLATINTISWHPQHALLAVASYSHETGGTVTICDELVSLLFHYYHNCLNYIDLFAWSL